MATMNTCPPCNNHCNQGMDCPNYDTRNSTFQMNLSRRFDEVYIKYRDAFPKREYVAFVDRNDVLEEVAKEIEKMTAFGPDTIGSFAVYIRNMKR